MIHLIVYYEPGRTKQNNNVWVNLKTSVDNMSVENITNAIKDIMVNSAIITFPKKPVNRRTVTARKKAAV